jgi:hypothetical protein
MEDEDWEEDAGAGNGFFMAEEWMCSLHFERHCAS